MELTILETSDLHGYLFPTTYQERDMNEPFGILKAATVFKEELRKANGPVFVVENGDYIQGSSLSYYLAKQRKDPSELMQALNAMEYDVGVLGNHSFNYGLDYLKKGIAAANFPVMSANILNAQNKPAFGKGYTVFEKEGVKIGFLGLTTQYITQWEHPKHYAGLHFQSAVECAKEIVPLLREEADIVVVSYHGGFERDLKTGEPTETLTGENEGYQLVSELPGIDVLLTGHQHRTIAEIVNGVAVIQPSDKGSYVGKVTVELDKGVNGYKVVVMTPSLISVKDVKGDETLCRHFEPLHQEVEDWLDQTVGVVDGDMRITDPHQVRIKEHPYIELIQKVQMDATGADISGTALFNNQGIGFGNTITTRDIVTNYIYPNTLAVLCITGADLRAALEQSAGYFALESDGTIGVNPDFMEPKPQHYNYDMYEGIEYIVDVAKPIGSRIVDLTKDGKAILDDELLEVVTNQYRAVGGGDYSMFDGTKIVREVTTDMSELIGEYIKKNPVVDATVNDNFKVVVGSE
ncbi:bifunctional metallophosphatase/5'-nucleotidase [Desemzia sp. RIT804]|uniref:bifunctional metallophosphatase/5'-nucleotidase n=1 Tax=Desemzia sp. RIT 804 TaxID=2810209 RepID=UPI00194F5B11|nr:bifunctional UDP-sugar hydrolase/5'-nucleotidase [Desemzia sp. RIT 804]MBM6615988.1 bifunctional metallophosphatase/5'-nucleotidase [Desemzia sp. RIT 804]